MLRVSGEWQNKKLGKIGAGEGIRIFHSLKKTCVPQRKSIKLYCLINLSLMGEKYNKTKIAPEVAPPIQSRV